MGLQANRLLAGNAWRTSVCNEFVRVAFSAPRVDSFRPQSVQVRLQAHLEFLVVARAAGPPGNFRKRKQPGEGHELEISLRGDELRPNAGLDPNDLAGFLPSEAVRHRFPGEDLGDRLRAALVPLPRRARFARALVIVEIKLVGG